MDTLTITGTGRYLIVYGDGEMARFASRSAVAEAVNTWKDKNKAQGALIAEKKGGYTAITFDDNKATMGASITLYDLIPPKDKPAATDDNGIRTSKRGRKPKVAPATQ